VVWQITGPQIGQVAQCQLLSDDLARPRPACQSADLGGLRQRASSGQRFRADPETLRRYGTQARSQKVIWLEAAPLGQNEKPLE